MGRSVIYSIPVLLLVMLISASAAHSQGRLDSRNMTCNQARDLVRNSGAVVMSTGRFTFERVVYSVSFCQSFELTKPFYAPTLDVKKCNVGNKCVPHYKTLRN